MILTTFSSPAPHPASVLLFRLQPSAARVMLHQPLFAAAVQGMSRQALPAEDVPPHSHRIRIQNSWSCAPRSRWSHRLFHENHGKSMKIIDFSKFLSGIGWSVPIDAGWFRAVAVGITGLLDTPQPQDTPSNVPEPSRIDWSGQTTPRAEIS